MGDPRLQPLHGRPAGAVAGAVVPVTGRSRWCAAPCAAIVNRRTRAPEGPMKVDGTHYRPIWQAGDGSAVEIIDQTRLPHAFVTARLETMADAAHAIRAMLVRGAPLIGATAAWGLWLAMREDASDAGLASACETLMAPRPTAVTLRWALDAGDRTSGVLGKGGSGRV